MTQEAKPRSQEHEMFEAALLGAIEYMRTMKEEYQRQLTAVTEERDRLQRLVAALRAAKE